MRAALAMVLVSGSAFAGWRSGQVLSTPTDVQVFDSGIATVAGSKGSVTYTSPVDGGFVEVQGIAVTVAGVLTDNTGCLWGVRNNAGGAFSCGLNTPTGISGTVISVRPSFGAGAFASSFQTAPNNVFLSYSSTAGRDAGSWVTLTLPNGNNSTGALSPIVFNGAEWALFEAGITGSELQLWTDGGVARTYSSSLSPRDLELFLRQGKLAAAELDLNGALSFSSDLLAAAPNFTAASVPVNTLRSFAYTERGGAGFGVAVGAGNTFGAIPNPNAPGLFWKQRTGPTNAARVSCLDPTFCAAVVTQAASPNFWWYFNEYAPFVDASVVVMPEGSTRLFTPDAGDLDGDPVFLAWSSGLGAVFENPTDGGDGTTVRIDAPVGTFCTALDLVSYTVNISDGYAAHDRAATGQLQIQRLRGPAAPVVQPNPLALQVGGSAGQVSVTAAAGGCAPTGYVLGTIDAQGVTANVDAGAVSFVPPLTLCQPDGGLARFTVTTFDAVDASVPLEVDVVLKGWGAPTAPVFDSPAQLTAGTTQVFSPLDAGAAHLCASTAGFPGTVLRWSIPSDSGVAGVSLNPLSNGVQVVSALDCVAGTVVVSATRQVQEAMGLESTPASLQVNISPVLGALDASTPFALQELDLDGGFVAGLLTVTANCPQLRSLSAAIDIFRADGGRVVGGEFGYGVPWSWSLPFSEGCNGGTFTARAQLLVDGGAVVGAQSQLPFTTPPLEVAVGTLAEQEVEVRCEMGAHATVHLNPAAGSCRSAGFDWVQSAGPVLENTAARGESFELVTREKGLEALAGEHVVWQVSSDAGFAAKSETREVELVAAPFITLAHRTDSPLAKEEQLLGVEVELTNTTTCDVSALSLKEALGGLHFVAGSARVDGAPLTTRLDGDVLWVEGLTLAGNQSLKVTYLAKVPLVSSAHPQGDVFFRGRSAALTQKTTASQPRCGCGSSGTWPMAVFALLLCRLARRRVAQSR